MRKIQRWRYYCDFCKKAGGSAGHMKRHESGCTANPGRVCRVCPHAEAAPASLATLVEFVQSKITWHPTMHDDAEPYGTIDKAMSEELRRLADGCPVCMFAALRQSKAYVEDNGFKLKDELKTLWSDVNDNNMRREHGY